MSILIALALGTSTGVVVDTTRFAVCRIGPRVADNEMQHRLVFQFDTRPNTTEMNKLIIMRDDDKFLQGKSVQARRMPANPYDGFAVSRRNGKVALGDLLFVPNNYRPDDAETDSGIRLFALFLSPLGKGKAESIGGCVIQGGEGGQLNARTWTENASTAGK
jgi:hypothetical protein